MTEQSSGGFGPDLPASHDAPAFTVAGPTDAALSAARSGSASFTVSNVSGREVRARVFVTPGAGAEAAWFQIAGDAERSMPMAGTSTIQVDIAVPKEAPAGSSSFALAAALEESPDRVVTSPTVAIDVPPVTKRRFPWWIVIVAVVALLLLAAGAFVIWLLTRPSDPVSTQAPEIVGTAQVGQELTVVAGEWDPDDVQVVYVWQRCPAEASESDDSDCVPIELAGEGEGETATAQGSSYVLALEDEGMRVRVIETAFVLENTGDEDAEIDIESVPQTSVASSMTDGVAAAPPDPQPVPNVEGMTLDSAQSVLAAAGFQILATTTGTTAAVCDPPVLDQNPGAGQTLDIGSVVAVTRDQPNIFDCGFILPDNWWFDQELIVVEGF